MLTTTSIKTFKLFNNVMNLMLDFSKSQQKVLQIF